VVVALAASPDASVVYLGTATNEVISVELSSQATRILVQGHNPGDEWTGEVGALAVHGELGLFVTAGDDKAVCVWNCDERRLVGIRVLDSSAQSADISDDGKLLAVGLDDGHFVVMDMCTLTIIDKEKHRKARIQTIRYSPDGRYLAVGSAALVIDIHDTARSYKRVGLCSGHSGAITHIDWSSDSQLLQSNCGAYAHLVWTMPKGGRATSEATIERTEWSTWTCTIADQVKGIFPPGADKTDVNAVDRSRRQDVVATGDDKGKVRLVRYPCPQRGQEGKEYSGHSSFVQNVRFTGGDRHVVTVGGMDPSTMQWRPASGPSPTAPIWSMVRWPSAISTVPSTGRCPMRRPTPSPASSSTRRA
jgi:microtubule-associated protein-like 1/2